MSTKAEVIKQEFPVSRPVQILGGLALVVVLSILAWWITKQVYGVKDMFLGVPGKVLEYPLWGAIVGLVGNLVLKLTGIHAAVKPGIRTELFLKTGLVLMGAGINLALLVTAAGGAILQAFIMISSVFFFTYWLAGKFGLDEKLRAVMSTALSVCGVSAAIAAAGSVLAKKEQVTYVTTLVILVALPLMIIAPLLAGAIGLPESVAGAWFGGNIDTTAAVVGAGTIYGEQAQKVASIVKQTQNALIGLVAFLLAVAFAGKAGGKREKVSAKIIWDRFPKFVLGFVVASIIFTILVSVNKEMVADALKSIDAMKNWFFTAAFVCMGLELSVGEFKSMGWKPVAVFLIATVFNTLLALGVSWVIFTYLFPL